MHFGFGQPGLVAAGDEVRDGYAVGEDDQALVGLQLEGRVASVAEGCWIPAMLFLSFW